MGNEWIKEGLSDKESNLLFLTFIQSDINPYRHYLSLPEDIVPWVLFLSHSKKLTTTLIKHYKMSKMGQNSLQKHRIDFEDNSII